jgi:Cytochrome c
MKKIFFFLALIGLIFLSCTNNSSYQKLFNTKNLRTQRFSIDPKADTTLFGLRGGIFSIKKGSFEGDGPIDIDIKEAYSPAEIVYAGLTTESNGRLLESGGMVYFNARRDNKQVKLLKSVSISIPTNYVSKEMKLFKGEEKSDETINWKDPEPLDSAINRSPVDTGKILFETKCASCHQLFKTVTGPVLAFVEDRINDRKVLKEFIRNPAAVMAKNSYFQCQKIQFGGIMMTAYPALTEKSIDQILDYIKNEGNKRPDLKEVINSTSKESKRQDTINYFSCISAPCGFDTTYVDTTEYNYAVSNMMDLHEEATKEDSMDYLYKKPDSFENTMRSSGFIDIMPTEGRYNFTIKTLGWFNIDAFYEGMKGTEIVDLFVKTDFEQKDQLEIHVFFPAKKLLTVGTLHNEDGLFHFEKYKGQIPLFLNDEAIAFGFTSIKEKIYYGIASFKVSKQQTININLKESTKEAIAKAFKEMRLDGVDLDVITKKRVIVPKICSDTAKSYPATIELK